MKQTQSGKPAQQKKLTYLLYVLLIVLIVAYALHNNIILGLLAFIVIVALVVVELRTSVESEGLKKSVVDIVIAVAAAVALWLVLTVVLHTSSPIDAVASCSMLPVLHRGDLVALHGIVNASQFLEAHNVTVVNVSAAAFAGMEGNINNEFLSYFAYYDGNTSKITQYINDSGYSVALYNTACIDAYADRGEQNFYGKCIESQANNLIKYNYTIGNITVAGVNEKIVETSSITIGNTTVSPDYNNPIIVYRTTSQDYFSGDIIHRVYAAIKVGNDYYFLTKGDNNQALDIEFANYPPSLNQTVGYTVADIPVIGYVKLILDGQLGTVAGCNQQIARIN